MYDIKNLYEARSVRHAIDLRLKHPQAHILAGGSDILIQIREGKKAGIDLISIYGINNLRGVQRLRNKSIRIGSLTSFSHIIKSPIIQKYIPVLGEAVEQIGGPQLRNIGTIGGNTCNGITSADSASTLLAYDAIIELQGQDGVRHIPIKDFYLEAGKVDIKKDEIQTAIIIDFESYNNCFAHYIKYSMRKALDIATISCSVNVVLSSNKKVFERVRVAYGVAGPIPRRAINAEAYITGKPVSKEVIKEFLSTIKNDINPRNSWRASKEFRQHIAIEIANRCLLQSIHKAGGELF